MKRKIIQSFKMGKKMAIFALIYSNLCNLISTTGQAGGNLKVCILWEEDLP